MKDFLEYLKNNPIMTTLAGLVIIAVYVINIDDRYAHAADVTNKSITLAQKIEINKLSNEINTLQIRESMLKDKVFDISVKPKLTQAEDASLARYVRELDSVASEISAKKVAVDNVQRDVAGNK